MTSFGSSIADILKRELSSRLSRNSRYSLRAFARDLGVGAPTLSRILNGDRGISKEAAVGLGKRLSLSAEEQKYFIQLADAQYARGRAARSAAREKLSLSAGHFNSVQLDVFQIISDWHHFAILSLFEAGEPDGNVASIARRLSISKLQVTDAIARLMNCGMLVKEGTEYRVTGNFYADPKDAPTASLRQFHTQLLEKALAAIHQQGTDERDFSSLIMPVSADDIPEAKRWIRKFREEFDQRFSVKANRKDQVMVLGIQYYRLSTPPAKVRKTK